MLMIGETETEVGGVTREYMGTLYFPLISCKSKAVLKRIKSINLKIHEFLLYQITWKKFHTESLRNASYRKVWKIGFYFL